MGLLGKPIYISNHGTSQGIITRFFLHFQDMSKIAFLGDKSRSKLYVSYEKKCREDFTNFYDLYHRILDLRKKYIEGIVSGIYFKNHSPGNFMADKSPEVEIKKAIQDFFRDGKSLLNNFAKSGLLDDGVFQLSKLLVVSPKNYKKAKQAMLPNLRFPGYNVLFCIVEDAEENFKREFFRVRDDFEHNGLQISDFQINAKNQRFEIIDPTLNGINIFKLIDKCYYATFDLIESLAAYFFGINAHTRSNGIITLFYNKGKVDPSNFFYQYKITLNVNDPSLIRLID